MTSYTPLLEILEHIKQSAGPDLLRKHGIRCVTGEWLDCAVLKLQKESWTDGGLGQGVFFSVWVGEKELKKKRFNYNIHAYKLRLRKGYSIKPREFASSFRTRLASLGGQWPNVKTDYGPQTLMQGWLPLDMKNFESDVLKLTANFVAIHGVIDDMLEERKTSG